MEHAAKAGWKPRLKSTQLTHNFGPRSVMAKSQESHLVRHYVLRSLDSTFLTLPLPATETGFDEPLHLSSVLAVFDATIQQWPVSTESIKRPLFCLSIISINTKAQSGKPWAKARLFSFFLFFFDTTSKQVIMMKMTSTLLLLVELAAANPIIDKPVAQISDAVVEGGRRLQLAGMHFPPKEHDSSSLPNSPRRHSLSSKLPHRMPGNRIGVTRVPGEPMGPLKKHPCCNGWHMSKRSLGCVLCEVADAGFDGAEGTSAGSFSEAAERDAEESINIFGEEDVAETASEDWLSSGELTTVASEGLEDTTSGVVSAATPETLPNLDDLAATVSSEVEAVASEDVAAAIAAGFPVELGEESAEAPKTSNFGWRRLGAANKHTLYYKPGRESRRFHTSGLKSAIILKALTLAGPSGREGLREGVPGFKAFDDFISRVQEYLFGAQRSDIDGNETKAALIEFLKRIAEATQPALTYQPSPYERSYKERMDEARKYEHPVHTTLDKCIRVLQDPHPNFMYQIYLETINCGPLYEMPKVLTEPNPSDDPELTPKERCQRIKGDPHANVLYQSYLELINCEELADKTDYRYPLWLNPGEKCFRIKNNPDPRKEYQAYMLALYCDDEPLEILPTLPPNGLPQPGTPQDLQCSKWLLIKNKQNCAKLATLVGKDRDSIVRWNSPDQPSCPMLWVGRYACIGRRPFPIALTTPFSSVLSPYHGSARLLFIIIAIMVLGIAKDSLATVSFVVCVVTAPLALVATLLRFAAAARIGRRVSIEDWCALAALVVFLAFVALIIYGEARHLSSHASPSSMADLSSSSTSLRCIMYGAPTLFVANQCFVKFSILLLYLRLFAIEAAVVRCVYAVAVVHVCYCVASLPLYLFRCRPVRKGWDIFQQGTCIDFVNLVPAVESVNSAVDLALVVLACFMVRRLRVTRSTKWRLSFLFALGGLAGVIGFVKIGIAYVDDDVGHTLTAIWTIVQMAVSIICCCAPTYKSILPSDGFLGRLRSRVRSWNPWRRSSKPDPSQVSRRVRPSCWDVEGAQFGSDRGQGWLTIDLAGSKEQAAHIKEQACMAYLAASMCLALRRMLEEKRALLSTQRNGRVSMSSRLAASFKAEYPIQCIRWHGSSLMAQRENRSTAQSH
ncbi:hypothetical protein L249_2848 [Ophiocordyceps polyrhachis-furcata BCC 54312]|uniref:Rhodopsin domain-containing protein n=1 Tax=Ophiocordyceps polyrhachis-furcata BCC 54312 TaxID=1330021 RepID=A0A367LPP8_9HYPO|nr:hypothetical protein L249_2848 [Ophiocordyceps polyrhachis-furcata BCC 54312]